MFMRRQFCDEAGGAKLPHVLHTKDSSQCRYHRMHSFQRARSSVSHGAERWLQPVLWRAAEGYGRQHLTQPTSYVHPCARATSTTELASRQQHSSDPCKVQKAKFGWAAIVSRLSSLSSSLSLLSLAKKRAPTHFPFEGSFCRLKTFTQDTKSNVCAKQLTVPVDADLRHGSSWLRQPESKREEGERVSVLPATRKSTIAFSGFSYSRPIIARTGSGEKVISSICGPPGHLAVSLSCLSTVPSLCTVVHAEVMVLDARRLWTVTGLSLVVGTKVNPLSEAVVTESQLIIWSSAMQCLRAVFSVSLTVRRYRVPTSWCTASPFSSLLHVSLGPKKRNIRMVC